MRHKSKILYSEFLQKNDNIALSQLNKILYEISNTAGAIDYAQSGDPDGVVVGKRGDTLFHKDGSNYYFDICISGTNWKSVQLS